MLYKRMIKDINKTGDKTKGEYINANNLKYDFEKYKHLYIELESKDYIKIVHPRKRLVKDGVEPEIVDMPEYVRLKRLPNCIGFKFDETLKNSDVWKERIWGFIAGIVVGIITTVVADFIINCLTTGTK